MRSSMTAVPGYVTGTWRINPVNSEVRFTVRHLGVSKVHGRFKNVAGAVVTGEALEQSSVTATIDAAGVDTGFPARDAYLRGADVLAADEHRKASVEMLFHRTRKTARAAALTETRTVGAACELYPFDSAILTRAMDLIARHTSVRGRDAVHAATALENGIESVLSPDPAFDGIPGLTRVDPRDLATFLN